MNFLSDNLWEFIESDKATGRNRNLTKTPAGVCGPGFTDRGHVGRRGVAEFDPGLFEFGDWSQSELLRSKARKIHIRPLASELRCSVLSSPTVSPVLQLHSLTEQWPSRLHLTSYDVTSACYI